MHTRRDFEAAIAANPYDESPHRIYSDWLLEHGFDDEAKYHAEWTVEKYIEEKIAEKLKEKQEELENEYRNRGPYWEYSDYMVAGADKVALIASGPGNNHPYGASHESS